MTVQATVVLKSGAVVQGVNYRLAAYASPYQPGAPASPPPFNGGMYHVQTAMGWIEVPATQIATISTRPVAHS
jgi:hypothetical protein